MSDGTSVERRGRLALIQPGDESNVLVFGDLHGDLSSLKKGLALRRPQDYVLFLGDYADRGPEGVEVIEGINMLLKKYPDKVAALMGNHEEYSDAGEPTFSPCTLIQEAERKRGSWHEFFSSTFSGFLQSLSLSALIPGCALFVHGGLSARLHSARDLERPEEGLARDLLWSDPGPEQGSSPNIRGAGTLFGPDVTRAALENVDARVVLRSHEPRKAVAGPAFDHGGRVVTLNSTRVYGGRPFVMVLSAPQLGGELDEQTLRESVRYLDS